MGALKRVSCRSTVTGKRASAFGEPLAPQTACAVSGLTLGLVDLCSQRRPAARPDTLPNGFENRCLTGVTPAHIAAPGVQVTCRLGPSGWFSKGAVSPTGWLSGTLLGWSSGQACSHCLSLCTKTSPGVSELLSWRVDRWKSAAPSQALRPAASVKAASLSRAIYEMKLSESLLDKQHRFTGCPNYVISSLFGKSFVLSEHLKSGRSRSVTDGPKPCDKTAASLFQNAAVEPSRADPA